MKKGIGFFYNLLNAPRPRLFPAIFSVVGPSAAAPLCSFLSLPALPAARPHCCSQSQLRARFTYLIQQSRSPHDIYVLHLAAQKEKIHPGEEDIVQKKYGRERGAVVNRKRKNLPRRGRGGRFPVSFAPRQDGVKGKEEEEEGVEYNRKAPSSAFPKEPPPPRKQARLQPQASLYGC